AFHRASLPIHEWTPVAKPDFDLPRPRVSSCRGLWDGGAWLTRDAAELGFDGADGGAGGPHAYDWSTGSRPAYIFFCCDFLRCAVVSESDTGLIARCGRR